MSRRHLFSKRFGLGLMDRGYHAAVHPQGDVVLAGDFQGAVDFGTGLLTSGLTPHSFLARLDRAGNPVYGRLLGTGGARRIMALAVTAGGHCLVVGQFSGVLDLGGIPLRSRSRESLFVARFNEFGDALWSRSMDGDITGRAVAAGSAGQVFVTGHFSGVVDFGWGPSASRGGEDAFLWTLDAAGNPIGLSQFGGPEAQRGYRVVVGPGDEIVLSGYFEKAADFGGGLFQSPAGWSLYVARFSAAGEQLFSRRFEDASVLRGHGIGVDGQGHVIVASHLHHPRQADSDGLFPAAGRAIFMAKLGADGSPVYVKRFCSTAMEFRQGLAVDEMGHAIITGHVIDAPPLHGQRRRETDWSLFVTKVDPCGRVVWSRRCGPTRGHFAQRVGVCGAGAIVLTGYFSDTVDFGGGPLASGPGAAIFVAKLSP